MNAVVLPSLCCGAAVDPATIVTSTTGTIILAFRTISELWCRPLGYEPKVLIRAFGSCLLPVRDFAHKIRQGNTSVKTGFGEGAGLERPPLWLAG